MNARVLYIFGVSGLLFISVVLAYPYLAAWIQKRFAHDRQRFETVRSYHPVSPRVVNWIVAALYSLLGTAGVLALLIDSSPVWGLLPLVLMAILPKSISKFLVNLRRRNIERQIPTAARMIANSVRAGLTLAQAIELCATEASEPIRSEFGLIHSRWRLGADIAEAVEEVQKRLALSSFTLFGSALQVNRDVGGNLPEILSDLAAAIESSEECRQQVLAATSEGRSTIRMLAIAPVIMLALVYFLDPQGTQDILTTFTGQIILLFCAAPAFLGVIWARQITTIKV